MGLKCLFNFFTGEFLFNQAITISVVGLPVGQFHRSTATSGLDLLFSVFKSRASQAVVNYAAVSSGHHDASVNQLD